MSRRRTKDAASGGETEVYPTPRWATERLLEDPTLPGWPVGGRWLEPCAERGQIIRCIDQRIHKVEWTAVEVLLECAANLGATLMSRETRPAGRLVVGDFLALAREGQWQPPPGERWAFDAVITNPPYSIAYDFVDACRQLAPLVVMLLPLNIFESADRAERHHMLMPSAVRVLPDRPSFDGISSDSRAYGWMVWDQHSGPETKSMRVLKTTPEEVRVAEKAEAKARTIARIGPEEWARREAARKAKALARKAGKANVEAP